MTYPNYNKLFNDVAHEQGLEPGSPEWNKGGMAAYSGQSGGHASYGWNHENKLDAYPWYSSAVIASYCHRRCYELAPVRQTGYLGGGRPSDYKPSLPGDEISGEASYLTSKGIVQVSGPDFQHFQMGPLFAVCDSKGHTVKAQGKDWDASLIAGIVVRYLMKCWAGMILKSPGKLNPYTFGDRGAAVFMNSLVQAAKRNLIFPEDKEMLFKYVTDVLVPYYEKPFPVNPGAKGSAEYEWNPPYDKTLSFHQTYNGLWWLLPPFYDAAMFAPPGELQDDLSAIVYRWSKYLEDLETLAPGKGVQMAIFSFPKEVTDGINGKPVPSLLPYVKTENIHWSVKGGTDWSLWGLKAQHVGAKVLDSSILQKSSTALVAKWKPKVSIDDRAWLVDAEGAYLQ